MGTPESCRELVWRLSELGVTEIACLVDFLPDSEVVLAGLGSLFELVSHFRPESIAATARTAIDSFSSDLEV